MNPSLITLDNRLLPEMMSAVVLEKPFHLKFAKIPLWPIKQYNDPDIILIKVRACGVCGSDFRYYQGENPWAQHTKGIHVENPPNIVLGHEYTGEVVAVLAEENIKWLGKRVVPICSKVCNECIYCITNRAHLCEKTIHMGHGQGWGDLPYYPGAYADYAPAWGDGCYEIPPNLTYEEAALMDVLAVCTHAFRRANHHLDMPVLIMGAGPIGNGIAQVAQNSGVAKDNIVIMENNEVAIRVAEDTGFQNIVDSTDKNMGDLYDNILKFSRGKLYSVFDSIGTNFSFKLGLKLLEKGGTLINLAVHDQNVENLNQMQLSSERKITTSSNFSRSAYEQAWKWLQRGEFTLTPWLNRISLEDVPKIFEETIKKKGDKTYFKLVILPNSME